MRSRLRYLSDPVVFAPVVLTVLGYFTIRAIFSGKLTTVGEYWASAAVVVVYLALALLLNRMSRKRLQRRTVVVSDPENLEFRLYELSQTLGEAGRSLKDIEKEILARESVARTLTSKTEQLITVAEMDKEDARLIGDFLTQQLASRLREMKREGRFSFVIGLLCSVPIGVFVNILTR